MNFNEDPLEMLKRNVKTLCESKGMTQGDLAKVLHTTQSNISKHLSSNMNSNFSIEQLIQISNIFNVSINDLLGNETVSHDLSNETLSIKEICSVLAWLIRENYVNFNHKILVNEKDFENSCSYTIDNQKYREVFFWESVVAYREQHTWNDEPLGTYGCTTEANFYNTFYFSNYLDLKPAEDCQEYGNENEINREINKFLEVYLKNYKSYCYDEIKKETLIKIEKELLNGLEKK